MANQLTAYEENLKRALKALNFASSLREYTNGVISGNEDVTCKLVLAPGHDSPRDMLGYMPSSKLPIDTDGYELQPVTGSGVKKLASMVEMIPFIERADGNGLYLDGEDMIVRGSRVAVMETLRLDGLRELGRGEKVRIDPGIARVLIRLAAAADAGGCVPELFWGVPDGETFVLDMRMPHSEAGDMGFLFRIEQPLVFAPWIDFTEVVVDLMGPTDIMLSAYRSSLRTALTKAEKATYTKYDKDKENYMAELILNAGSMSVRPLMRDERGVEEGVAGYIDNLDPYPIKLQSYAGTKSPTFQFVATKLLRAATELIDTDAVNMNMGHLIGSSMLLWNDDTRIAIRTAERMP